MAVTQVAQHGPDHNDRRDFIQLDDLQISTRSARMTS